MSGRGDIFDTATQVADTITCALNRQLQYGPHRRRSGAEHHFTLQWRQRSEPDLLRRLARQEQQEHWDSDAVRAHASRGAVQPKRSLRCMRQKKWVMQEHLRGPLWNSENSFTGNWISNDTKWKWSCESVPLPHKPTFPQSRWDSEAMREGSKGRARGSKRCLVKNHNSLCFIKLYGFLMTPRSCRIGCH